MLDDQTRYAKNRIVMYGRSAIEYEQWIDDLMSDLELSAICQELGFQAAIAAALDGQSVGACVPILDQPFGGRDEIVEHILLAV